MLSLCKGGSTDNVKKCEYEGGMLMRRAEPDDNMSPKQEHQTPYRPRLAKLNTLRRPSPPPNRVTATYHNLLENSDDLPPAEDTTQG